MDHIEQQDVTYAAAQRLRPGRPITIALCGILLLVLMLLIAGMAAGMVTVHIWTLSGKGLSWSRTEQDVGTILQRIYAYSILWAFLTTAVLLVNWMYKSHKALRRITATKLRYPSNMAFLGWVLPRLCLIRPFEFMRELYAVSRQESIHKFRPMIGVWWALWLLTLVISIFGVVVIRSQRMSEADMVIAYFSLQTIHAALHFTDGFILLLIVWTIDRAQAKLEAASQE